MVQSNILSIQLNWTWTHSLKKKKKNSIGHQLFQSQTLLRFSIFILYDQVEHVLQLQKGVIIKTNIQKGIIFFVQITCFSQFVKLVLRASRNACTVVQRPLPFKCTTRPKQHLLEPQPDNMPQDLHRLLYPATHFLQQPLMHTQHEITL